MQDVIQQLRQQRDTHVARLKEWLRIPSVSTDSSQKINVRRAGEYVLNELKSAGFTTQVTETAGHAIVTADWLGAPGAPTVLVYGHYDVQPPDPIALWRHGPFEPTIEGRNIIARGATDDKGQVLALVRGIAGYLKQRGKLPVNVKFLIEGEEEIGSPNLTPFIKAQRARLAADVALISDTSQFGPRKPALTIGLKGLAYLELEIQGPNRDLHSGSYGGAVANPGNVLCWLIGQLRDADGRVTIPGFYDDVIDLTAAERAAMRTLNFDEEAFRRDLNVSALFGETGYTTLERKWARPTLDVNGLLCGWTGEGAKTVLPAKASAKFSMRLVAKQEPERINALVTAHLKKLCPPTVTMKLSYHHGSDPVRVPADSPFMKAAHRAVARGFEVEPVYIREGGSIPVVSTFKRELGIDTILLGIGLPDDNAHSPNEKFDLDDFQRGIETAVHLLDELASVKR
ncbi:MAG: dipeptidase [Planctomycetota bacterium]